MRNPALLSDLELQTCSMSKVDSNLIRDIITSPTVITDTGEVHSENFAEIFEEIMRPTAEDEFACLANYNLAYDIADKINVLIKGETS